MNTRKHTDGDPIIGTANGAGARASVQCKPQRVGSPLKVPCPAGHLLLLAPSRLVCSHQRCQGLPPSPSSLCPPPGSRPVYHPRLPSFCHWLPVPRCVCSPTRAARSWPTDHRLGRSDGATIVRRDHLVVYLPILAAPFRHLHTLLSTHPTDCSLLPCLLWYPFLRPPTFAALASETKAWKRSRHPAFDCGVHAIAASTTSQLWGDRYDFLDPLSTLLPARACFFLRNAHRHGAIQS